MERPQHRADPTSPPPSSSCQAFLLLLRLGLHASILPRRAARRHWPGGCHTPQAPSPPPQTPGVAAKRTPGAESLVWDLTCPVPCRVGAAETPPQRDQGAGGHPPPFLLQKNLHPTAAARPKVSIHELHPAMAFAPWRGHGAGGDSAAPPRTACKLTLHTAPKAKTILPVAKMILLPAIFLAKSKNGRMDAVL